MSPDTETQLLIAIDGLRSDVREDLQGLRGDIQDVEKRMISSVTDYTTSHAKDHAKSYERRDNDHARYDLFIRNAELAAAQRDGALGVLRFVFELVARHANSFVRIALALAAAGLVASGNIHISIS